MTGDFMLPGLLALLFGYGFGSIPFGLILSRLAGLGDVRRIGSGNIGATNVLRTGNKKVAALTLAADMAKGLAPVLIVHQNFGLKLALLAGLGAMLGHIFPIWLKFKGGKGVATYIGVLAGLFWPSALIFCLIWLASAFTTRISSLSALIASALVPLSGIYSGTAQPLLLAGGLAMFSLIIFAAHHENIGRLIRGTESRIGGK
ncbi:MAG: acyl-phosphate glycerol 3-phosphate acyltransferase [Hyphomicrobiales bacterium]|nr:MAG: acyl-phosphate glycerol 3-phosphate acyltransferase [Hyphomicrobiales bacterium]